MTGKHRINLSIDVSFATQNFIDSDRVADEVLDVLRRHKILGTAQTLPNDVILRDKQVLWWGDEGDG